MSYWERDQSYHLYAPTYRERIKKAWGILTKGETTYKFEFWYRFPQGEGGEHTVYIDDRALVEVDKGSER